MLNKYNREIFIYDQFFFNGTYKSLSSALVIKMAFEDNKHATPDRESNPGHFNLEVSILTTNRSLVTYLA